MFSLDRRSIALFRIIFGLIILYQSYDCFLHAEVFFSDAGIWSRAELLKYDWSQSLFSVFLASGSAFYAQLICILMGIAGIGFLIGFYPQFCSTIVWIIVYSLHQRMPLVFHGGDVIFRMMLFWAIFLPLDSCWAVRPRTHLPKDDLQYKGLISLIVLVQIGFIYFIAAYLKDGNVWIRDFNALQDVIVSDMFVRPWAKVLLNYPGLLKFLTASTMIIEYAAPFLLIVPWKNAYFRSVGIALLFSLHLGIFIVMDLQTFPFVAFGALALIAPSLWWPSRIPVALKVAERPHVSIVRFLVTQTALVLFLAAMIQINLVNSKILPPQYAPKFISTLTDVFYMEQRWNMFAPYPLNRSGWAYFEGTRRNGTKWDPLREAPPLDYKPVNVIDSYPSYKWRKLFENAAYENFKGIFESLVSFYCRKSLQSENEALRLKNLSLFWMDQAIDASSASLSTPQVRILSQQFCVDL